MISIYLLIIKFIIKLLGINAYVSNDANTKIVYTRTMFTLNT